MQNFILTVRQDINGFVVDVEKATEALSGCHERPVAGENVRIELEMSGHIAPALQQQRFGHPLMRCPGTVDVLLVVATPRTFHIGDILARHRLRMAR